MNFNDLQVWHYAVAGCGVLLLLATFQPTEPAPSASSSTTRT